MKLNRDPIEQSQEACPDCGEIMEHKADYWHLWIDIYQCKNRECGTRVEVIRGRGKP